MYIIINIDFSVMYTYVSHSRLPCRFKKHNETFNDCLALTTDSEKKTSKICRDNYTATIQEKCNFTQTCFFTLTDRHTHPLIASIS